MLVPFSYKDTLRQAVCSTCHSPLTQICSRCFGLVPSAAKEESSTHTPTIRERSDDEAGTSGGESFSMDLEEAADETLTPHGGTSEQSTADNKKDVMGDNCGNEVADIGGDAADTASLKGGRCGVSKAGGDSSGCEGGKHLYMCAWCDVSFPSIQNMARHLAVHASLQWQRLHRPSTRQNQRRGKLISCCKELEDHQEDSARLSDEATQSSCGRKKASYKCLYCCASYKKTLTLTKHLQKHLKRYAFKCCDCESSFMSLKELETHVLTSPHDFVKSDVGGSSDYNRPHQCRICGMRFRYLGFLANHAEKHTEPNPFWCSQCQHGFQFLSDLTGHKCQATEEHSEQLQPFQGFSSDVISLEQVQGDKSFPCSKEEMENIPCSEEKALDEMCEEQSSTPRNEADHSCDSANKLTRLLQMKGTAEEAVMVPESEAGPQNQSQGSTRRLKPSKKDQPYQCPDCPSAFKYASGLKIHSQKHTGQNAFPCPQCDQSFPSKKQMLMHQEKDHWGSTPFTCHECGRVLKSIMLLDQHLRLHTGELPFQCRICGENFKSHTALSVHRRSHKADCFRCRECGASFRDHNIYKVHMDEHSGFKPHLCSKCGAAFAQRTQLKKHLIKHGRKQFVCEHCGRAFYTSGEYKTHVMRHLGIKPFACEHCDMRFIRRDKLTRHHRSVHLQVKLFKCSLCAAAYSDVSRLNEHVRATHTNERPYKCPVCGKAFAKSGCRQAHLRIHKREAKALSQKEVLMSAK